jgi:hypothetical protein
MRYPHLSFESAFPMRFEALTRPDREKLAGADLIVTKDPLLRAAATRKSCLQAAYSPGDRGIFFTL